LQSLPAFPVDRAEFDHYFCISYKGGVKAELVPVSWERMIRAVQKVLDRMLRAVRALEHASVPYAIVGGNAVAAWVSRVDEAAVRNTRDVYILLRRADLDKARLVLETAGFVYLRVSGLGQPGKLELFLDGPNASARDALRVVFASEKVRADSPVASPDVVDSEATDAFRLISLEGLVKMKLAAFRDKDRTHLCDLIDVGLLDASWISRVPAELGQRLATLLNTPEG
jgi:hypothetical protein